MRKKLQVFISSTYTDLIEERQAAVQAVLKAGHIPAGMELFKAGDETQKETIMRWIDESDVYMLILGGRYGSIEPISGKSYTHWEYDYAGEKGKPRFAMVISEKALNSKISSMGQDAIERANLTKYEDFKNDVLCKIAEFFNDARDIQLTVTGKLADYALDNELKGWVSGHEVMVNTELNLQVEALTTQIEEYKVMVTNLQNQLQKQSSTSQISKIEDVILMKIYDKDYNASGVPFWSSFKEYLTEESPQDMVKELAYYISKMERFGLLSFHNKPFVQGGRNHSKYNNNTVDIMFDKIYITEKGVTYYQENQ